MLIEVRRQNGTFDKYLQLADKTYFNRLGKVTKIVGLQLNL